MFDLFDFIQPNSSILDCGSGWGGPATILQQHLNCSITEVTNSIGQFDFVKHKFKSCLEDLHTLNLYNEQFDLALFLESFTHLTNPTMALNNIKNNVNSILIKDYTYISDYKRYIQNWGMTIYTLFDFVEFMNMINFKIKYVFCETLINSIKLSCEIWHKNLIHLDTAEIFQDNFLTQLYDHCNRALKINPTTNSVSNQLKSITIFAEKIR